MKRRITAILALILSMCIGAYAYTVSIGTPAAPTIAVNSSASTTYYYACQAFDKFMHPTPPSTVSTVSTSAAIPNNTGTCDALSSAVSASWFGLLRMKGADGSTAVANRLIGICGQRDQILSGLDTHFACPVGDVGADFITALSESINTVTATTYGVLPNHGACTAISTPWPCCTGNGTGSCPFDVGASITVSGAVTSGYNVNATILSVSSNGSTTTITYTDANGSLASCASQGACSAAANNPAVIDLTMAVPTVDYTGACKYEVQLSAGSGTWTDSCITTACVPSCTDETAANAVKCPRPSSPGSLAITGTSSDVIAVSCQ